MFLGDLKLSSTDSCWQDIALPLDTKLRILVVVQTMWVFFGCFVLLLLFVF